MKILNLYAGIGGNREKWRGEDITAVEIDPSVANIYKDRFPNDTVVVADAHEFLLHYHKNFDFIWSSPPCPTHSKTNNLLNGTRRNDKPRQYPDMTLYQEIVFLSQWFKGLWVVENVIPYYDPLIKPSVMLNRHYFWANFMIAKKSFKSPGIWGTWAKQLEGAWGINLSNYPVNESKRTKMLRNMVNPELGLHLLNCAKYAMTNVPENGHQLALFDSVV